MCCACFVSVCVLCLYCECVCGCVCGCVLCVYSVCSSAIRRDIDVTRKDYGILLLIRGSFLAVVVVR